MYRVALNVAISFYRINKKFKNNISFAETDIEIEDKMFDSTISEENLNLLQQQIAALKELY